MQNHDVSREAYQRLAIELKAMGCFLTDQVMQETETGTRLKRAAFLLERACKHMCNKGMIGCSGNSCNSDSHK